MSYDAFYEKLEENTFVAFIMKHPVVVEYLPTEFVVEGFPQA